MHIMTAESASVSLNVLVAHSPISRSLAFIVTLLQPFITPPTQTYTTHTHTSLYTLPVTGHLVRQLAAQAISAQKRQLHPSTFLMYKHQLTLTHTQPSHSQALINLDSSLSCSPAPRHVKLPGNWQQDTNCSELGFVKHVRRASF